MVSKIGKYAVEKELGHGGFGDVYLAYDPDVGQKVAIKHLRVELGTDPDMLRRFQHEIRTTASLRHKNIVAIFASGVENGNPYLVMEFLEGQTLKDVIQSQRPLNLLDKVNIMTQVAEGLAYAHGKGIVHRDVKPENIMLLPDDSVKIMDFGIALAPDRNTVMTATGGIIGTPPYFAPEQLEGYKASEQTDIFSLGDVYYELLSGRHPFERFRHDWKALQLAILSHDPASVGQFVPGCPESLELLVHRMLAKEPEFRYRTFEEVIIDSRSILSDLQQERAISLLQQVHPLVEAGDLQAALGKIREIQQLDPANREARQLRDTITQRLQRVHVQGRVSELMAEAGSLAAERRFAEAVQSLESAARLDGANTTVQAYLTETRAKLDAAVRASRLVSEARYNQQKGQLAEAMERLTEALSIDPQHTEAMVLGPRLREQLDRLDRDRRRQTALAIASEHLGARRFAEATAVLTEIAREQPGATDVAQLLARVEQAKAEDERRVRTEKFNLGVARTREALESGELERARQMIDHLFANFSTERGAAEVLPGLREQLASQIRSQQVAAVVQEARDLLRRKAYSDALAVLARARGQWGNEGALVELEQLAALEQEEARYNAGLDQLLRTSRDRMAAGKYSEALEGLTQAREYTREAQVRALREQIEKEQRRSAIEAHRTEIRQAIQAGAWTRAEAALRLARSSFPQEATLEELAGQVEAGRTNSRLEQWATEVREKLASQRIADAVSQLESERTAFSHDSRWKTLQQEVAHARQEEQARQTEIAAFGDRVRAFAGRDELDEAAAELARGRARHPVATLWTTLQGEVQSRRTVLERLENIAQIAETVRGCIGRDDLRGAAAELTAAKARYPAETLWGTLQAEIEACRKRVRDQEVTAAAESVRQGLERDNLEQAAADLSTARTRYPGEKQWEALGAQIATRGRALREIRTTAQDIRKQLKRGQIRPAAAALNAARQAYPGEELWDTLAAELDAREGSARDQEIAAAAEGVRRNLQSEALPQAAKDLAAARAKWPGESVWDTLQAGISSRQEIASAAEDVRRTLLADSLTEAVKALSAARARYPGELVWDRLQGEIAARQDSREKIASAAENIRRCLQTSDLQKAENELSAARRKWPSESLWDKLQSEISAQQTTREKIASAAENIRRSLQSDDLQGAGKDLAAARSAWPGELLWDTLQQELTVRQGAREGIDSAAGDIRRSLLSGNLSQAGGDLAAAKSLWPGEGIWDKLQNEVGLATAADGIRRLLQANDLQRATKDLAAARAKFPGEGLWDTLQYQVGVTSAAEGVRRSLQSNDFVQAGRELTAARAKYPGEGLWETLQSEISARQDLDSAADSIRRCLQRNDLSQAAQELAAAREQYPGKNLWDTLQGEISSRQDALREKEIAATVENIRQSLQRDELREASSALASARLNRPGARIWEALEAEIEARQRALREIASSADKVRKHLQRGDLRQAVAELGAARTARPGERIWDTLQTEIDTRQGSLRDTEIASAAGAIRQHLELDDVRRAATDLAAARAKHPGERLWETLQVEITARQAALRDKEIASTADGIRQLIERGDMRVAALQLGAARTQFPGERIWETLRTELDSRQSAQKRQEEIAAAEQRIRGFLEEGNLKKAAAEVGAARRKYPQERAWAALEVEIDARQRDQQAQLRHGAEIGALAARIREHLARGDVDQASRELAAARAKEPEEMAWATLDSELAARRAQLTVEAAQREAEAARLEEERRQRELQEHVTTQRLAMERLVTQAIPIPVEPKKPPPWKWIGIGIGAAAAAVGGALVVAPHLSNKPVVVVKIPVEVRSDPPGASITFGDQTCGAPPCRFDLPAGQYKVRAEMKGFEAAEKTVTLDAAVNPNLVNLTLAPVLPPPPTTGTAGTLTVRAGQAGALVTVDGKPLGRTDSGGVLSLTLAASAHEVRVEKDRYQPVIRQVTVTRGGSEEVTFTLSPKEARVELLGAPAGIELRAGGKLLGRTDGSPNFRFRETVPSGPHTLQVSDGSANRQIARDFQPDETVSLNWKDVAPSKSGGVTPPPPPPPTEEELDNRDWAAVRGSTSADAVRSFLATHPKTAHRSEADALLDKLAWDATNRDNVDSLQAYVKAFGSRGAHTAEANMRLADLPWNKVDKTKPEELRKFVAENPGNPHVGDANKILDQVGRDAEQSRLRLEAQKQAAAQKQGIVAALERFNKAFADDKKNELRAVWPGNNNKAFVDSVGLATNELRATGEPVITGEQATIICSLTTTVRQNKKTTGGTFRVVLQKRGAEWIIQELTKVN